MAEFGLAAGVLQVADFGTSLGSVIWKCAKDIRDARKDIESVATEVEATSSVLRQVGSLLNHPDTRAIHTDELLDDTGKVLDQCKSVFTELEGPVQALQKKLADGHAGQRASVKLQWPMDKPRLTTLREILERHRTGLHLLLTALQIVENRQSNLVPGINRVEARLGDLLLSSKHLFDSHQSLSAQVTALVQGTSPQRPISIEGPPISSPSPQVFMSFVHQQGIATDSQTSRSVADTRIEKQRERDQQKIIQDQLQSCMDAVRRLAGSLSSAMDSWTYQTGKEDHGIHSSLKCVLDEIGHLTPQLKHCALHGANDTLDVCTCSLDALNSFTSIFGPYGQASQNNQGADGTSLALEDSVKLNIDAKSEDLTPISNAQAWAVGEKAPVLPPLSYMEAGKPPIALPLPLCTSKNHSDKHADGIERMNELFEAHPSSDPRADSVPPITSSLPARGRSPFLQPPTSSGSSALVDDNTCGGSRSSLHGQGSSDAKGTADDSSERQSRPTPQKKPTFTTRLSRMFSHNNTSTASSLDRVSVEGEVIEEIPGPTVEEPEAEELSDAKSTFPSHKSGKIDETVTRSDSDQVSNGDEPRPIRPRTFRRISSGDTTAVDLRSPMVIVPPNHLLGFSDAHEVAAAMELARMDLDDSLNEHSVPLPLAATTDSSNVNESEQNESCASLPDSRATEVESESFQQRDLPRHTALVAQELASRWFKGYANQGLDQAIEGAESRDEEGQDQ